MPIPESIQRIYTKVELRSIELEKKQEESAIVEVAEDEQLI